ncbi:hypothetical protein ColKHC_05241 [Colletotrichum higginsianum]|nr:hypothetical protein ColKHC_05241 [Colletotrichum higginsianum]
MEFTLTFGAVGDFIAVIEVVRSIIVALDDCRGSVKENRDVVQSLEVLRRHSSWWPISTKTKALPTISAT